MKQSQPLLLTLGAMFWVTLGLAGPVFKTVLGMNDLSPTLFLVFGIPLWVFAVSSTSKRDAVIGSIGGVVFAGAVVSVDLPLHVRALYWQDACETQDADACFAVASYYRDGYSYIGGYTDAVKYQEMGQRWLRPNKRPIKHVSTIESRCLNGADLNACSRWIDRGYYPESKIACGKILSLCHVDACEHDVMRCRNIVEPWPKRYP